MDTVCGTVARLLAALLIGSLIAGCTRTDTSHRPHSSVYSATISTLSAANTRQQRLSLRSGDRATALGRLNQRLIASRIARLSPDQGRDICLLVHASASARDVINDLERHGRSVADARTIVHELRQIGFCR